MRNLQGLIGFAFLAAIAARPFPVYDNMFYRHKPSTARAGLIASNILYERDIWPHNPDANVLPDRGAFAATVRAHAVNPGPLVLDIENLPVQGAPEVARRNLAALEKLADWAHEAAPGKVIGVLWYAHIVARRARRSPVRAGAGPPRGRPFSFDVHLR